MPEKITDHALDYLSYYTTQSATSDPGRYAEFYDAVPKDVAGIVHTIHGLMIHNFATRLHGLNPSKEKLDEINFRKISDRLARLLEINSAPLTEARTPEERVIGTCRDFALLFVSIARHNGISARERVGFAPYLGSNGISYDHRVAEYWHARKKRWILVDPQIDAVTRQANKAITFDTLNMVSSEHFYLAGDVWQRCRKGETDPLNFRDSPEDIGIPAVLLTVVQDLERLNKIELLGWDE